MNIYQDAFVINGNLFQNAGNMGSFNTNGEILKELEFLYASIDLSFYDKQCFKLLGFYFISYSQNH